MRPLRALLQSVCWLALGAPALAQLPPVSSLLGAGGATVQTEQVRAQLLVNTPQGVQPGQRIEAGLLLEHAPHWHTYWQNPGDSGLATTMRWTLPAGVQAGEIEWPLPRKFPIGTLANYGYEGKTLLPVTLMIDGQARLPETLQLELQAQWLACRQECIPQEGRFSLAIPTAAPTATHAAVFEATRQQIPQRLPNLEVQGRRQQGGSTTVQDGGQQLLVQIEGLPAAWRGQRLSLFPVTAHVVHNAARQDQDWTQQWQGGTWSARVPVSAERAESPSRMQWVLARGAEQSPQAPALHVDTPVQGAWPALQAPAEVSPELARALADSAAAMPARPASASPLGLGLALLGALLGGLILNLMPCVFPVLAIKVLGFARPGQSASEHRAAGLAYTTGAVLSFVLLGGLMLALRAAGEQLGWGFQLQSPAVVTALALLFTLLGLNLAGLFEFGQVLPSRLASLQSRHPTVDAGLSGVLAVAVASPCTAPFMGASLGLAVSLPAWQALPVFGAMGLGMALPYLLVSFWPALAHRLPRPGAWMQTFRQFMAFPMLATVVWLLWVLGLQTGMDAVALVLAGLLTLALLLWALQQSGRTRLGMTALALALLAVLGWQGRALQTAPADHTTAATAAGAPGTDTQRTHWQPWSPATFEALLAAGKPVFVDFTAAWCVTCQYNKKTVLADAQVLAAFDAHGVVTLRADWTRRDDAITRTLNALGRSGVPVYALYRAGQPPQVLSELPSVREVVEAVER